MGLIAGDSADPARSVSETRGDRLAKSGISRSWLVVLATSTEGREYQNEGQIASDEPNANGKSCRRSDVDVRVRPRPRSITRRHHSGETTSGDAIRYVRTDGDIFVDFACSSPIEHGKFSPRALTIWF
jgi:hypothetical protein